MHWRQWNSNICLPSRCIQCNVLEIRQPYKLAQIHWCVKKPKAYYSNWRSFSLMSTFLGLQGVLCFFQKVSRDHNPASSNENTDKLEHNDYKTVLKDGKSTCTQSRACLCAYHYHPEIHCVHPIDFWSMLEIVIVDSLLSYHAEELDSLSGRILTLQNGCKPAKVPDTGNNMHSNSESESSFECFDIDCMTITHMMSLSIPMHVRKWLMLLLDILGC